MLFTLFLVQIVQIFENRKQSEKRETLIIICEIIKLESNVFSNQYTHRDIYHGRLYQQNDLPFALISTVTLIKSMLSK